MTQWLYNHRQLRIYHLFSFFPGGCKCGSYFCSPLITMVKSCVLEIIHFCYLITKWMIYIWWNYSSYILCFDVLWEKNEWYFVIKTMFCWYLTLFFLIFTDAMQPSNTPSDLFRTSSFFVLFGQQSAKSEKIPKVECKSQSCYSVWLFCS